MSAGVHLGTAVAIERLRAGRATRFTTAGISMEPLFLAGHEVLLDPCPATELRRGDLVAFERGGGVVLHRVLGVDATGDVVEKGDNVAASSRVAAGDVLGRATTLLAPTGRELRRSPWLARLSALHATLHRVHSRYPRARLAILVRWCDRLLYRLRGVLTKH